jgi:ribose/xylose/arabinose/galactoside ABC-type transport system permease subunit
VVVGLACGLVAGLINGGLIAYTGIPPFIATLGMMVSAQHLDIGQGEVPWDDFFGTLAEVGFDGIMTACVFAWEERAEDSSRFMRQEMQRYVDKYWK